MGTQKKCTNPPPRRKIRQIITPEAHHRTQIYTYIHLWEADEKWFTRPWMLIREYSGMRVE